jgi:hypothetical protein
VSKVFVIILIVRYSAASRYKAVCVLHHAPTLLYATAGSDGFDHYKVSWQRTYKWADAISANRIEKLRDKLV